MTKPAIETSPQVYARVAGALYLIVIVLGGFAFGYGPGKLVASDVATTASNILTHETLWRLGIASDLIVVVCAIPQLLCEYLLLRPVQRNIALLAVFFNLLSLAVESLAGLGHLVALAALKGGDSLKSVDVHQLQAWAFMAIDVHDDTVNISFVFFGATCVTTGCLIFRSGFLPRFLGVLMALAGACYTVTSLTIFLGISLGPADFAWMLIPAGLSELTLCLWLIVKKASTPRCGRRGTQSHSLPDKHRRRSPAGSDVRGRYRRFVAELAAFAATRSARVKRDGVHFSSRMSRSWRRTQNEPDLFNARCGAARALQRLPVTY